MDAFCLKCFGVGDGWPSADRNHSAFLYRFGPVSFLIDCGEPVGRALKASGMSYDALDRIFISHLHFDHIGGFFMLTQGFWLERRRRELTVHLPAEGIAPIRQMLDAGYVFEELLAFPMRFEALEAGRPIPVGHVRVTPHPTTHLAGLRASFQARHPQPFCAYSFLLEADGLRVAHSADMGAAKDLEPLVREPLDLLVCELAHFRPESLFAYLRGRPIRRLVFIHATRAVWDNREATRQAAADALPAVAVSFAQDGEEIRLG
jgi:ribonuclease Z